MQRLSSQSLLGQELPGARPACPALGGGAVVGKGRALGILEWLCVCWRRGEGAGGRREGGAQHNREVAPEEANEPQLTRETALAYLPAHSICPSLAPYFRV